MKAIVLCEDRGLFAIQDHAAELAVDQAQAMDKGILQTFLLARFQEQIDRSILWVLRMI